LRHPRGKLSVAAAAGYGKVALIAEKIQYGRIGEMPEGGEPGPFDIIKGPVNFFPNDLKPAGPVKQSKSRFGNGRQKWHVFRNASAFLQFIVYI
jgi:hypothetical protein